MRKETARVAAQESIATDIYSLTLRVSFADEVKPGQFLSVYSADGARLLPRPISICDVDLNEGTVRLVYRIADGEIAFESCFCGRIPFRDLSAPGYFRPI